MVVRFLLLSWVVLLARGTPGCDLCAIYTADSAMGQAGGGFSLVLSEQYIPYDTAQLNGDTLPPSILDQVFLHKSMTHIVPTWSFSPRFGVSMNLPIIHERFHRMQLTPTGILTDSGEKTGLGDVALIGRCTVLQAGMGTAVLSVNVLTGVKFPTGDTEFLEDEVALTRELDEIYGPGHQHAVSGVHLSDLTLGSGSYDGIFGATVSGRWLRVFCNAQFQYYLRTPGVDGYEFGDEWMVSGGPGVFLFLEESFTLSLQALPGYEDRDPDILLGRENPNSGMTAVYLGPLFNLTLGGRFSANAGFDWPMEIDNNGLQNVPDYRIHAGASFRF